MGSCGEKVTLRRCVRIKKWAITRHPICIHLHLELPRPSMVRNNFLLYTGYPHFLVAVIVAKRDYALFLRCPLFLLPLSPASSLSILYKRAAWTWARTLAPFTDLSISGYGLTSQLRCDTHKASYKAQRGSDVNVFKENLSLTFSCGRIKKKKAISDNSLPPVMRKLVSKSTKFRATFLLSPKIFKINGKTYTEDYIDRLKHFVTCG